MSFIVDAGMATGPILGYVHQYRLIQVQKSVGTFSIDICGILLFANILRLNFYIFNQYQLALLFQSIFMISAQILLIHICTKYANKKHKGSLQAPHSQNNQYDQPQNKESFWRWNQFSAYLFTICAFAFITFSVSIIFKQLQMQSYGVMIGIVALLSESVLILPQILKNYFNQSTKGLSHILVTLNLAGDIFKLVYFFIRAQPFQFVLCGIIQVCLDSFVIVQIFYYKRLNEKKFQKQNKSLIVENNKDTQSQTVKIETQDNLVHIQLKNMDQLSPQVNQDFQFQVGCIQNNEVQNIKENKQRNSKNNEAGGTESNFFQKQPKDQRVSKHNQNSQDTKQSRQKEWIHLNNQNMNVPLRKAVSYKQPPIFHQLVQENFKTQEILDDNQIKY